MAATQKKITIRMTRSLIGCNPKQRATMKGLGMKKINQEKLEKKENRKSKKELTKSLRQNKKQLKKDEKQLKKMNKRG